MSIEIDYTSGFFETKPSAEVVGTVSGNAALDLSSGSVFNHTPTADTTFSFTNPPPTGSAKRFSLALTGANVAPGFIYTTNAFDATFTGVVGTNPYATVVLFSDNGLILNVIGYNGVASSYNLSAAFDVSSTVTSRGAAVSITQLGSYLYSQGATFIENGTKLVSTNYSGKRFQVFNCSTPFDVRSAIYSSQGDVIGATSNAWGCIFNNNGTKLYTSTQSGSTNYIKEFTLTTAFDISTRPYSPTTNFSYSSQSTSVAKSFFFNADGSKLFVCKPNTMYEYALSTPFALSSASYTATRTLASGGNSGDYFYRNKLGTKVYVASFGSTVSQYSTSGSAAPATFTYPSSVEFPGGITPTPPAVGATDILTFYTSDAGTTYHGLLQDAVSNAYTLPTADGTNGQVLTTNGSGVVSFATAGGGGASDINGLSDAVSNSNENVALGANSGISFLSGSPKAEYNTFVGHKSGRNLTSGESNVAVGAYALNTATTADWNVSIGVNSLLSLIDGDHNIGIGYQTARTITTGTKNLAIGNSSLYSNTTGSYNIVLGDNAGYHITTGPENTIVGFEAGRNLTAGTENTSLGYQSGNRYGTHGAYNVSIGSLAMGTAANSSNSNNYNVAVGYQTLYVVDGGQTNTALGSQVLFGLTTGDYNAGVGGSALVSVTTGVRNTGVGFLAGFTTTSGDNNASIGNSATPSSATVDNEVTLGNTSITALRCQATSITSLSDARDKTDIAPLQAGLDFVEQLNPVSFNWNMRDGGKVGIEDTGFIAQDLQQVQQDTGVNIPGLVYDENPEKLEAAYGKLVPVLVQAIKDLSAKVNELEAKLN